jgi:hypothetical protein
MAENEPDPVAFVVSTFAAAAKSNSVLMTDKLSVEDRLNFEDIIVTHRSRFQALLRYAAKAMTANPRRSRATSRPGSKVPARECTTLVEYSVPEAFRPPTISKKNTTAETAAKALVYLNDMKRPNVLTTLHYKALLDEYAMPSNLNVLIG